MNQVCLGDIKIQDKRDDSRVTRTESFIYEIRKIIETYKCSWMILLASAFAILSGTLASRDWFNAFCEVRATAGEQLFANHTNLTVAEKMNEPCRMWCGNCDSVSLDFILRYTDDWDEEVTVLLFILALPFVLTLNHIMSSIYLGHRNLDSWKTWTESKVLDTRRKASCC